MDYQQKRLKSITVDNAEVVINNNYRPSLDIRQTQRAIKLIKDNFEENLATILNLDRVSAPLFVADDTGINDGLNGWERPVSFEIRDIPGRNFQIVQSLAKWKRWALGEYGYTAGQGLYTDMNAIRRDEDMDNIHSVYVDQWDWEKIIDESDRTLDFLRATVQKIIHALKQTEHRLKTYFPQLDCGVNEHLHTVTSQQLEDQYPDLTPKQREDAVAREFGTVLLTNIGGKLRSGKPHDGRAPDYDDWSLNGDILVWYEPLDRAMEISSMGIRVSPASLRAQLAEAGKSDMASLPYHRALLEGRLPYTIGGGIGQSRLCMLLLGKMHVGEVQSSAWSEDMRRVCGEYGIALL